MRYLGALVCWLSGFCAASAIYTLGRTLTRPSPDRLGTSAFYVLAALVCLWLGLWLVSRLARKSNEAG